MEAVFFAASADLAGGVRGSEDLVDDPAADPLAVSGLGALRPLAGLLAPDDPAGFEQLRDATCQSFPVWRLGLAATRVLRALSDSAIDSTADRWLEASAGQMSDVDHYELATRLTQMRDALNEEPEAELRLFVLLEERAF